MGLFKFFVNHYDVVRPIVWSDRFLSQKPLNVEIGCGNGEFLVRQAREHPERNFVGIEQSWERIEKTLKRIVQAGSDNARVMMVDARVALERLFLPGSIDRMDCLFPCPWPKKSHIKHRLFSQDFLRLANSRLVPKGHVRIVTDYQPYSDWILGQVDPAQFSVKTGTVGPQYDTKYERKWSEQGQREFFSIDLAKERHADVVVKEDVVLEKYVLKSFDPDKFAFEDRHGPISVIFKDFIFDVKRQTGLLLLLVAEDTLTQYLWIKIFRSDEKWLVVPASSNRFIPSAGIAQALSFAFQAAQRSGN